MYAVCLCVCMCVMVLSLCGTKQCYPIAHGTIRIPCIVLLGLYLHIHVQIYKVLFWYTNTTHTHTHPNQFLACICPRFIMDLGENNFIVDLRIYEGFKNT